MAVRSRKTSLAKLPFESFLQDMRERLIYILNLIDESLADPDKSSGPRSREFRLLKLFFRGKDNALDERWKPQQVEVHKKSREKPFGVMIQYLRRLKGLDSLSLETLRDVTYIYYYYYYILDFLEEGAGFNSNRISKIKKMSQPSMYEFVTLFRGSHSSNEDRCWSYCYETVIRSFDFNNRNSRNHTKSESFKGVISVNRSFKGLDMPVSYLDLMFSKLDSIKDEALPELANVHQLWDKIDQLAGEQKNNSKEDNEIEEEEEYSELSKNRESGLHENTESLSTLATALVIRALNKAERANISVSREGVKKAVQEFGIPYQRSAKNLYAYTQSGSNTKDPMKPYALRSAERWLNAQGYRKAEIIVKKWLIELL